MPTDAPHDGVNLIPFLKGEKKEPPHERLFWRTGGGLAHAIRDGNWKLVRLKDKPVELYDLAADIGEAHDLTTAEPEVVTRLTAALDSWNKELIPPAFAGLAGQKMAH